MTTETSQKTCVTPSQAFGWTMVAFLVTLLAWALGPMLDPYAHVRPMISFVKGLIAIVISGFVASMIAGWFRKAIRGN